MNKSNDLNRLDLPQVICIGEALVDRLGPLGGDPLYDHPLEDYLGGAEITSERFIDEVVKSGKKICKIRSSEVSVEYFEAGINKYWIFFNYSAMNMNMIPTIVANLRYSIVEYDYKCITHIND